MFANQDSLTRWFDLICHFWETLKTHDQFESFRWFDSFFSSVNLLIEAILRRFCRFLVVEVDDSHCYFVDVKRVLNRIRTSELLTDNALTTKKTIVLRHLESAALSCSIATKAPISVALDRNERYTRISLPKSRPILRVSPSFPRVRACARFPSVLCPSIRVSTPKGVEEEQGYRARAFSLLGLANGRTATYGPA